MSVQEAQKLAQEIITQQRTERYQSLLDKGLPTFAAAMLATHRTGGYSLPNLDELVGRFKTATEKGLPEIAAVTVATAEGTFRYVKNGLDKVVENYQRLVQEGVPEQDAAKKAIF